MTLAVAEALNPNKPNQLQPFIFGLIEANLYFWVWRFAFIISAIFCFGWSSVVLLKASMQSSRYKNCVLQSLIVRDTVRECLEKDPADRTEDDIEVLLDFMQHLPVSKYWIKNSVS